MNKKTTLYKMVFIKGFLILPLFFLTFCQKDEISIDDTNELLFKTSELVELMKSATKKNDKDDNQCVKFKYPIIFFAQVDPNQPIEIVTITNDEELYNFFDSLSDNDQIRIDFPIILLDDDGGETPINSIEELEETLQIVVDACRGNNYDYCDDKNKKVYICHKGKTICVSINAIKAHLDHGDVLGKCDE